MTQTTEPGYRTDFDKLFIGGQWVAPASSDVIELLRHNGDKRAERHRESFETCPDCKGSGCQPGTTPEVCPDCKGTGSVRTTQRTPFGMVQTSGACKKCGGRGKIIHQPCPRRRIGMIVIPPQRL